MYQESTNPENLDQVQQEQELTFFDKVAGIITEPSNVFESIKKFPFRTIDWLIPVVTLIVLAIISNIIILSNPEIKADVMMEQRAAMQKQFDEQIKAGKMTQEQADKAIEQAEAMMEGGTGTILRSIGTVIFIFLLFFILCLIYFVIWKFVLKGVGDYRGVMAVYGLSYIIGIIEIILVVIFSLAMSKTMQGISVASFIDFEKGSTIRYIMTKLDPFTIWGMYVIGVGLGKVFSVEKVKSLITVYALWVLYVIVAKFIPFLNYGG